MSSLCWTWNGLKRGSQLNGRIGLDVGLNHFYTNSDGNTVENPRYLRKAEQRLKRSQRKVSKTVKGSKNRRKAVKRLGERI